MRFVLIMGGALFGLALANGPTGLYGAAIGAFVGFVFAELASARARVSELERDLASLRREREKEKRDEAHLAASSSPREAPPQADARHPGASDSPNAAGASVRGAGTPGESPAASTSAARGYGEASHSSSAGTPGESPAASTSAARGYEEAPHASSDWKHRSAPPEELAVVKAIREYFTGGNTLVRVGVVILFIGVAFLLKYVAEHTHVPIEFRLSGVAAAALVLLIIGWRLRKKRPGYALTVQGGAIGILYLTVFASLRLFHVLPAGPAFAVLVVLSAASAALAVLQNSMALSLFSIGCGFLAPILASSGQGNHVILFSYYGVLNLGILAIAWFKAWRPLNVVGFLFTFVIGTAWGVLKYRPELFSTTEPFLIAFFILYVVIAILFSLRQQPVLKGYVDGTIVFGVPVVAFSLQSAMVHNWPFAAAYSAAAVSAMYLALAWILHKGKRDTQRLLVEAFMALGIAFLTLTVPLALDGRWSAATWSLEGAALIWAGCRQNRMLPRVSGALLQIASGVMFFSDYGAPHGKIPVLNSACLGGLMIAAASIFGGRTFQKYRQDITEYERPAIPILFAWGVLWWLFSGLDEIWRYAPNAYRFAISFVFLSVTALLSSEVERRLEIRAARIPPLLLLPAMVMAVVKQMVLGAAHPLTQGGWFAWPIAFAVFYFLCRRHETDEASQWRLPVQHIASALLLTLLLSWEFSWQVDHAVKGGGSWPAIAWVLVPAVILHLLPKLAARGLWPIGAHQQTYVVTVGLILAVYLALWSLGTNATMPANPYPLPFVPILNPLDLAELLTLLVLARYGLHLYKAQYPVLHGVSSAHLLGVFAVLSFVWLNAVLLRAIHHWIGIPYEIEALFHSPLVQAALSIFWTSLALATMLVATRRGMRTVWLVGAGLMAVVVIKLAFIDSSRIGTLARIVSFVGVGVLLLVLGYFSPLPPERKEAT
jgi:uncharacterized membrane protein